MIQNAALILLNLLWVSVMYGADSRKSFIKYDRTGRILPNPHSEAAREAHQEIIKARLNDIEKQSQELLNAIKGVSLEQQQKKIVEFNETVLGPIQEYVNESGAYLPHYYTIQGQLAQRLDVIKFNMALENVFDSSVKFSSAFGQYIGLATYQLLPKQIQTLWKATLLHGNAHQIQKMGALVTFLPEHADGLYKRIGTFSAKEQLICVETLLKKSQTFGAVLKKAEKKQGEALWGLSVRAAIAEGKGTELIALFEIENKKTHDQLFMHTIAPFLSLKKIKYQQAFAMALSTWSQYRCEDDSSLYHGRYQLVFKLIQDAVSFRKTIESGDYGPYVRQWWGNFQVMVWKELIDKKISHASSKNEELTLLKKAEALFAGISIAGASVLSSSDNRGRLSMHSAIVLALLKDANITEKLMLQWCENALKSGVNILNEKYVSLIARRVSSAKLISLVQPYIQDNPELLCSLADLYQTGHQIQVSGKPYWWIEQNFEKAKDSYSAAVDKGFMDALIPLASLMGNNYEAMYAKLNDLCAKFPQSLFLKIQKASFLCSMLTKNDYPWNQQTIYLLDTIDVLNNQLKERLKELSVSDHIYYLAQYASYEAVAYKTMNHVGTLDTKEAMDAMAKYVHTTYAFSTKLQNNKTEVTKLFDEAVYGCLRDYVDTLLAKERKDLQYTDLHTMAVAGYMMMQRYDKNTISAKDTEILDTIIRVCSLGDDQGKVPPLTHVLAYLTLCRKGSNEKSEELFSRIVASLQQDVSKDAVDSVARADGEDALCTMAYEGSVRFQMQWLAYKKNDLQETLKKMAMSTKQIISVSKEERAAYIKKINELGMYALLKERLLKSSCADCAADMVVVLVRWIAGITYDGDRSDHLLKPFFDDLDFLNAIRNGKKHV